MLMGHNRYGSSPDGDHTIVGEGAENAERGCTYPFMTP